MDVDEEPVAFEPPLYIQRDNKIIEIIENHKQATHILELGCGECRLIQKLKQISHLKKVIGVDKCRHILNNNTNKLKPLVFDYFNKRDEFYIIELFAGDIFNITKNVSNFFQHQLLIFSEVLEHLEIEDLEKTSDIIFGILSSEIIIVSTPNYEFNVCFKQNDKKFRHYDHKFEWTRQEFEKWCWEKASKYSYKVEFDGVGDPPTDKPHIGFCTQFSVFKKCQHKSIITQPSTHPIESFELIIRIEFPYKEKPTIETISKLLEDTITQQVYYLEWKYSEQDDDYDAFDSKECSNTSSATDNEISIDIGELTYSTKVIELEMCNLRPFRRSVVQEKKDGFIKNNDAYIPIDKLFQNEVKEYFHKDLQNFKSFLKKSYRVDESQNFIIKHLERADSTDKVIIEDNEDCNQNEVDLVEEVWD